MDIWVFWNGRIMISYNLKIFQSYCVIKYISTYTYICAYIYTHTYVIIAVDNGITILFLLNLIVGFGIKKQ